MNCAAIHPLGHSIPWPNKLDNGTSAKRKPRSWQTRALGNRMTEHLQIMRAKWVSTATTLIIVATGVLITLVTVGTLKPMGQLVSLTPVAQILAVAVAGNVTLLSALDSATAYQDGRLQELPNKVASMFIPIAILGVSWHASGITPQWLAAIGILPLVTPISQKLRNCIPRRLTKAEREDGPQTFGEFADSSRERSCNHNTLAACLRIRGGGV